LNPCKRTRRDRKLINLTPFGCKNSIIILSLKKKKTGPKTYLRVKLKPKHTQKNRKNARNLSKLSKAGLRKKVNHPPTSSCASQTTQLDK
jgi:hypothetical protein